MEHVQIERDFDVWRLAARRLLARDIPPESVAWNDDADAPLLDGDAARFDDPDDPDEGKATARVPKEFVQLARLVACHRSPDRWGLLYRSLWRIAKGERHLFALASDDDVRQIDGYAKAVRRDRHKMHAFVRFRKVEGDGAAGEGGVDRYVAWHRPDHYVVKLAAPFFRERFGSMHWTILTPDDSADWDGRSLQFGPGAPRSAAPKGDELEDLWRTYYANIFNPARLNLPAMRAEMPKKHWATMPEADLLPDLIRQAPKRVEAMMAASANQPKTSAADFLPLKLELPVMANAVQTCKGCNLWEPATQAVFGEGPADALCMFVGEQPGDTEDRAGHPFVGPAGQLLDELMESAGVDRRQVYVTNAVKHFKFEPRGARRIHAKPSAREVRACKPWLESEIALVKPKMLVCLGATAAQSLLGNDFRVTQRRGEVMVSEWSPWTMATIHPSALLRIPDDAARETAKAGFVSDMQQVARQLAVETRARFGAA